MGIGTTGGSVDGDERRTPPDLFRHLNQTFDFTLDPCSTDENALVHHHFTMEQNGLIQPWTSPDWGADRAFANPPYSRGQIGLWLAKARYEADTNGTLTVALIPGDSSTRWWHAHVRGAKGADHVAELERRVAFVDPATGLPDKAGAKFPSVLAFYWPNLTPPMFRGKRG